MSNPMMLSLIRTISLPINSFIMPIPQHQRNRCFNKQSNVPKFSAQTQHRKPIHKEIVDQSFSDVNPHNHALNSLLHITEPCIRQSRNHRQVFGFEQSNITYTYHSYPLLFKSILKDIKTSLNNICSF